MGIITALMLFGRLNGLIHVEDLKQCLAHSKNLTSVPTGVNLFNLTFGALVEFFQLKDSG